MKRLTLFGGSLASLFADWNENGHANQRTIIRAHVDEDVRPYVCVSEDCGLMPPTFSSAGAWKNHMRVTHRSDWNRFVHRQKWPCPDCKGEKPFLTQNLLIRHLTEDEREQHVLHRTPLEIARIAASSKISHSRSRNQCPLCLAKQTSDHPWKPGMTKPEASSGQPIDLDRHFATHLRDLAFLFLTQWPSDTGPASSTGLIAESEGVSNPAQSITLEEIRHLVRYAYWAYQDDDGASFRSAAMDLHGEVRYRTLEVITPFFKNKLKMLTAKTQVHLGIRGCDTLVLAFGGTDFPFTVENLANPKRWWGALGDVWIDAAWGMAQVHWLPPKEDFRVLAHEGYLIAFDDLLAGDALGTSITGLFGDHQPKKIEVCGHSVGAALATLCAVWCKCQWPSVDITCVALGSPRVGNKAFRQLVNTLKIRCYRLEVVGDPIPRIPNRFTQAVRDDLSPTFHGSAAAERRYYHVGFPILLHKATARAPVYAQFGVEQPDIEAEENAPVLPWWFKVIYKLGGFLICWVLMAPAIWQYHDPSGYVIAVERVLEQTPIQAVKLRHKN